mmetsp:Transcript_15004/g.30912  ORF Transcript_15004/g.30912 Transcript_15004/m.30912 type:complete len:375 (+) Transcript_15004:258-1382(+)
MFIVPLDNIPHNITAVPSESVNETAARKKKILLRCAGSVFQHALPPPPPSKLVLLVRFCPVFFFFLSHFLSLDLGSFDLNQERRGLHNEKDEHHQRVEKKGPGQHDPDEDTLLVEIVLGRKGFPVLFSLRIQPFRRSDDGGDKHQEAHPGCQAPVLPREVKTQEEHNDLETHQPDNEFFRPVDRRFEGLEVLHRCFGLGLPREDSLRHVVRDSLERIALHEFFGQHPLDLLFGHPSHVLHVFHVQVDVRKVEFPGGGAAAATTAGTGTLIATGSSAARLGEQETRQLIRSQLDLVHDSVVKLLRHVARCSWFRVAVGWCLFVAQVYKTKTRDRIIMERSEFFEWKDQRRDDDHETGTQSIDGVVLSLLLLLLAR